MQENNNPESKTYFNISELGICDVCELDNVHLVFRCRKCGSKFCLQDAKDICPICSQKCEHVARHGTEEDLRKFIQDYGITNLI
jgi:hypothetical protein